MIVQFRKLNESEVKWGYINLMDNVSYPQKTYFHNDIRSTGYVTVEDVAGRHYFGLCYLKVTGLTAFHRQNENHAGKILRIEFHPDILIDGRPLLRIVPFGND